ncbi:MAG: GNAT family N-acetyltransferase [Lacisediminihabitans sp.]
MTEHAQIRLLAPGELERLAEIENAADALFIEPLGPEPWAPARERTDAVGFILVAVAESGDIIGFAHVIELAEIAHLEQLSVAPDHGRRGHGRALLTAATAEARRRGYPRMTLRTFADIPWNGPFYIDAGFVETEPATAFHETLVQTEREMGLDQHGRRIQMTLTL